MTHDLPILKHSQTIAMARGLLAEGRALDVARMLDPLVQPMPEQVSEALDAGQVILRSLLARVRLLCHGDVSHTRVLLSPFDKTTSRETLAPAARAEVALWLGWMHTWSTATTHDAARALYLLDEAERSFGATMNPAGQCWALLGKARAYADLDEYPLMQQAVDEAALLHEKRDDAQASLWLHDLQTRSARLQGYYVRALSLAETFAKEAQHLNDAFALGRAYAYQALLYFDLGHSPATIIERATKAEVQLRRAAVKPGFALQTAYAAHVGALIRRGTWDQAGRLLDTALDATSNQPSASVPLLLQRAQLYCKQSHFAKAEVLLKQAETQTHPVHHRALAAGVALAWSSMMACQGKTTEMQAWATRAHAAAQESGDGHQQLQALLTLACLSQKNNDHEATHRYRSLTQPLSPLFSILPVVAFRYSALGDLALGEKAYDEAQSYVAQALTAATLIGDVYHAAQLQVKLATLERTRHPQHARSLLKAAVQTFEQLHATTDGTKARALLDTWPAESTPPLVSDSADIGAALARASLSIPLIAETWLTAAQRLMPDRWMGFYRCEEGHPWVSVCESGPPPAIPVTHEPCGPRLLADDVLWLRLRSHPGPAFFFGIALHSPEDPTWQEAYTSLKPWIPVATLALDHALLRAERIETLARSHSFPFDLPSLPIPGFVCGSDAMREVIEQVHRIQASHSPVLITGERGVGKRMLAQAVHAMSGRSSQPFHAFACADVADTTSAHTLDDALLGAKGGTLYLSDIDTLSLDAQQRVLRFLLQHSNPLPEHPLPSQAARLIVSTTQDLDRLTRKSRFLEELYYHFTTLSIHVPPLRQRLEDIPMLIRHYMNVLRPLRTPLPTLTNEAVDALLGYPWPGNIRQLRNEVERLLLFARREPAPLIDVQDLAPAITDADKTKSTLPSVSQLKDAQDAFHKPGQALDQVLADTERILIESVLGDHGGHVTASANTLGLTRQGLYKKMKRLGIDPSVFHPETPPK